MSNTGYYSAVYDQLREYSSLIESVLRQLKGDLNSRTTPEQQKLGALLRELGTGRPTTLQQLCIANVLRTAHRRDERFEKLAAGLDSLPRNSDSRLLANL